MPFLLPLVTTTAIMTATLFQASKEGNVELVSSLLEEPSLDIDARDETGLTALHYAVQFNHIDVVSQLLAKVPTLSKSHKRLLSRTTLISLP